MTILRKALIIVGSLALVIVGGLAGLYTIGVFINRHDRPPSATALQFAAAARALPDVSDHDNGYVYALGLGASPDADPVEIGLERAAWIRQMAGDPNLSPQSVPYPGRHALEPREERLQQAERRLSAVWLACDHYRSERCFETLEANNGEIATLLSESAWALARYRMLLGYSAWREVETFDSRRPPSPLVDAARLHFLLFLEAWTLASRGDAAGVNNLLDRDLIFWRRALADSDLLGNKMVIAGLVRDHFLWANVVLKRLPQDLMGPGIPDSWRVPLRDEERSLRRVAAGEWRYARNLVASLKTRGMYRYLDPRTAERSTPLWIEPFLQPQDVANLKAEHLARFAAVMDVPYPELPAALATLRTNTAEERSGQSLTERIYDLWGMCFLRATPSITTNTSRGSPTSREQDARRCSSRNCEPQASTPPLFRAHLRRPSFEIPTRTKRSNGTTARRRSSSSARTGQRAAESRCAIEAPTLETLLREPKTEGFARNRRAARRLP